MVTKNKPNQLIYSHQLQQMIYVTCSILISINFVETTVAYAVLENILQSMLANKTSFLRISVERKLRPYVVPLASNRIPREIIVIYICSATEQCAYCK